MEPEGALPYSQEPATQSLGIQTYKRNFP